MSHPANDDTARIKVREMLERIGIVMLVTRTGDDLPQARPMAIQKIEGDTVWFYTAMPSPKEGQIDGEHAVLLAAADTGRQDYVSARGRARVYRDVAKQKALWSESVRVWFPKGAEDASLGLIEVTLEGAEYWDSPSSTAVHAFGYVKAVVTGKAPDGGENAKVAFAG